MEKTSISSEKTQEPNPEQLLKLLETQVTAARARRMAGERDRGKAGTIGLFIIIAGAAFALWMLTLLLDNMRPQHAENGGAVTSQAEANSR